MNILAVVAHPDDEVLGVGATLAKHTLAGDLVVVLILGTGATARVGAKDSEVADLELSAARAGRELGALPQFAGMPDQRFDSVDLLEVIRTVERVIGKHKPETVYTHSLADLNADHRITHEAVRAACRPVNGCPVKRILAFETPSATEWGMCTFCPTVFVDVSGEPLRRKGAALKHYRSEMRDTPHPRSFLSLEALATWRGAMAGMARAEAFELVRELC